MHTVLLQAKITITFITITITKITRFFTNTSTTKQYFKHYYENILGNLYANKVQANLPVQIPFNSILGRKYTLPHKL